MVNILYSGTRTAETIIAGMFGGAIVAAIPPNGFIPPRRILLILVLALAAIILNILLHSWYEYKRDEEFR